jgi:hypothetical protein
LWQRPRRSARLLARPHIRSYPRGMFDRPQLEELGFSGFVTFGELLVLVPFGDRQVPLAWLRLSRRGWIR